MMHPLVKEGGTGAAFSSGGDTGVLTARGSWFCAERDAGEDILFRTTFAAAGEQDVMEAVQRFGNGLRAQFGLLESSTIKISI